MKQMRHGDVILIPITAQEAENMKKDAKKIDHENGRIILAYGEVTGHCHSLICKDANLWQVSENNKLLELPAISKLSHQEHKTIELQPGCYQIVQKRQYTPNGWETVSD